MVQAEAGIFSDELRVHTLGLSEATTLYADKSLTKVIS